MIEVEPVDLSAGETTIDFAFVEEADEEDLVGIWTVDGVEFNLSLATQLATFEATTSQIELYELLGEMGIENVLSANAAAYLDNKDDFIDELAANDEELTVAAIQGFVNDVNAAQVTEEEKEAAAQAVVKALGNNIELKAALAAFDKVNNAWIEDVKVDGTTPTTVRGYAYTFASGGLATALPTDGTVTADNVQDVIDAVNEAVIAAEITAVGPVAAEPSVDKAKLNTLKALIETYAPVDADGEFVDTVTIQPAYDAIPAQLAVSDVLAATTASKFKSTVTTLAGIVNTISTPVIDLDDYVDANGKAYIDYIKAFNADPVTGLTPINTASEIYTAITTVNSTTEADAAIKLFTDLESAILIGTPPANITTSATATQKAKFIAVLNALELEQVSSNKANVDEYITNVAAILTEVGSVLDPAGDGSTPADATVAPTAINNIQGIIDTANVDVVKAVITTPGTEAQLLAALAVLELDNIIEANAANYLADGNGEIAAAADADDVQDAIDNINSDVAIDAAVEAINDAETAEEVKVALDTLADEGVLTDYLDVTSADRIFIAEQVLAARDKITGPPAKEFADDSGVDAAVTAAATARGYAISHVNELIITDSLTDIANALLLVGHESLTGKAGTSDGTTITGGVPTANDTEIADAFITSLEFDTNGDITPQFRSIAKIRAAINAAIK